MRLLKAVLVLYILVASTDGVAASISFVRATSQYQATEDKGLYHPLNLLDDDPSTIWCSDPEDTSSRIGIEIVFKHKQKLDRVAINPSNKSGSVINSVRISDGNKEVIVDVGTTSAVEVFNQALEGKKYTITIQKVGEQTPESGMPPDVLCLADTLLYLRGSLFGGGASKLQYENLNNQLLGTWNGEPLGAPEKVLTFSADSSWEWVFTPLLGGKSKRLTGEYRFRGKKLFMRKGSVGRWQAIGYKRRRVKIDPEEMGAPKDDYDIISLGKGLGKEIAGEYNNARFQ
ncbi:MAG: hypothetical protein JW841_16210 [Deltaproteobacteria bacterium]|nr:hypothetical protein [Deltaproteobacteria bacterium]